jgi:hypothetical protein
MWDPRYFTTQQASTACYGESFTFYMQMIFVLHRKHLRASTACYGDSFTFLYADVVRTSQETHLRSPRPLTRISLHFIYRSYSYFTGNTYGPPRPATGIALPFYMQMLFVPHRKHAYGPPRPATGIASPFYIQMLFVPHGKHMYGPPRPVARITLRLLLPIWWQSGSQGRGGGGGKAVPDDIHKRKIFNVLGL